jgi:hypothetical protein
VVGDGAGRARGGQGKGKKHRSKALGKTVADAELERDMAEGSATMSETERKLAQAAMLRAMFLSFFRVLKAPHSVGKGVLRATLDGGPLCMPPSWVCCGVDCGMLLCLSADMAPRKCPRIRGGGGGGRARHQD